MNETQKITHVLDRLGFGARPGDRQRVERAGINAYLEQQLNPGSTANTPENLKPLLNALPTLRLSAPALVSDFTAPANASQEEKQAINRRQGDLVRESAHARLLRALESPHQLHEVMVDFWFNHFNVFQGKDQTRLWTSSYEQQAIRPHALGKFRTLLGATAKHPAMLFYLDNWRNTDPDSERAKGPFRGLNENYARELLELHTLGVSGGYSQGDVESLVRILTGWSAINTHEPRPSETGFIFVPERHAPGEKRLLDQVIADGGSAEGERALDLLAAHPATARHLSTKLAQYFVADVPPAPLVTRLAERFLASGGEIRAVLQALFDSDEFWQDAHYKNKFKTPYQYMLSLARAVGLSAPNSEQLNGLSGRISQLGMPIYNCRTPDGYAQSEDAWLSPDAMMRRVSLTIATVNQQKENRPDAATLRQTLGEQFSNQTLAALVGAGPAVQAALLLGSPEMMYR